jgi:hypothetical protein
MKRVLVALATLLIAFGIGFAARPVSAGPPFHCNQVNWHPNGPLANGQVLMPYNQTVSLTPNNAYFCLWSSTPTPPFPGVTLVPSGNSASIVGIPTTAGTYTFTLTGGCVYVLGSICNLSQTYTVTIAP